MTAIWNQILANVASHIAAEGIGIGVLFFAFVTTMPITMPGTLQEYWTWVRDALQTSIPARYHPPAPPVTANPLDQNSNTQEKK